MAFKLNSEKRKLRTPTNTTFKFGRKNAPIRRVDMDNGILGEANMDGTINVDKNLDLNSALGKRVLNHENEHKRQIESGEAAYDDVSVTWKGKKYPRKNGKIFFRTKWYDEGSNALPWEKEAIAAEKD
tara:strand:+ start:1257 stop:1640 length:384 start_codon:yes stop_codon:yes gene_type:complete